MPALTLSRQSKQRQVVILAVGGVLLAGLLMFQVPRTMKMLKPDTAAPPPPATATPTPAAPTPSVSPTAPQSPLPVDTPDSRQTASLARFTSKDPFVQQVSPNAPSGTAAPAPSASPPAAPAASATSESATEPGAFRTVGSSSGSATGPGATIAVNGTEEPVRVSNAFPKGNPVFKLVSVSGSTAKVGIASGTLKGGSETVTLTKGEPLTLLNTVDGKRYKLELIDVRT